MDRFEFFSELPRLNPGSVAFTSLLLNSIDFEDDDLVVDLEAGAGDRSVWLARSRVHPITAVNQDERFNKILETRSNDGGTPTFVDTVVADTLSLPFEPGSCKLILAEWAAVEHGFETSLKTWGPLLAADGYLALSYPGVKNKDAPVEARGPLELRMAEPMDTLQNYLKLIGELGFELVFQLPLSEASWSDFYADTLRRCWALVKADPTMKDDPIVKTALAEAKWYRRVGRGRVFLQGLLLKKQKPATSD